MTANLTGTKHEERAALAVDRYKHAGNGRDHEITWLASMQPAARARYAMRLAATEDELEAAGAPETDRALAIAILIAERDCELSAQRMERARMKHLTAWREPNEHHRAAQDRLASLLLAWYGRPAAAKGDAPAVRQANAMQRKRVGTAPRARATPGLQADDGADLIG